MQQPPFYKPDLAYIHDAGFGAFASGAAPGLLKMLCDAKIDGAGYEHGRKLLRVAAYPLLNIV